MASLSYHINWLGMWTLYVKEVRRFFKVFNQTLIAPMVNALLFLSIFSLAVGHRIPSIQDVPFQQFMASGIIMMTIVQQAFANTSSTMTFGKVIGIIIDYLIPPFTAVELTFAMVMAGITRGITAGAIVGIALYIFIPLEVHHWGLLIFYSIFASMMLSLLGLIAGFFADTFDQMAAITSYIITPLAFLSGTFYSVKNLPEFWQNINTFNPLFYMIDGFRYSMTNHADGSIHTGMTVLIVSNISLYLIAHIMFKTGYRIKS